MSTQRFLSLTKDTAIPISLGLLVALVLGVWTLAARVADWEHRLDGIEGRIHDRWTYGMERESWSEARALNPMFVMPNIPAIKAQHEPGG